MSLKDQAKIINDNFSYLKTAKQDTISDLETIREGAEKGVTATQPGDNVSTLTNDNKYQSDTEVADSISAHNTSTEAHSDIRTLVSDETTRAEGVEGGLQTSIDTINGKIPSQATTENQLADKSFVNSSIATSTANFVGTFDTLEELEAVENPTNNDYGFVKTTDSAGNTVYNRYKYVASTSTWKFEYALNNSSFTANQWAAINSGATTDLIGKISTNETAISTHVADKTNPHSVTKEQVGLGSVDNTSDVNKPVSTAQQAALDLKQDKTTAVTHTASTAAGSATLPVYVAADGTAIAITSYEGNAATATKATQDASGNVITTTYATKTEVNAKQDKLTAGTNVQISDANVISATDTTYTAGTNVQISDTNVISATDTTYTAGDGIKIEGTVISNTRTSAEWGKITGTLSDQTDLNTALSGKQDTISDLETIRTGAAAGATATQPGDNVSTLTNDAGYIDKNVGDLTKYTTTTNMMIELGKKQNIISDLADIRSGAAAGATALQPNDNISELTNDSGYITGITSSDVTTALGYTPYNSTNPSKYQTDTEVATAISTHNTSTEAHEDIREKIKDIELFKFPNAIIIGSPMINNGQVSNFTTANYMQFPFVVDVRNKNFEIDFVFTTGSDVTTQQNILDSKFGLALAIQNGKGVMALSSNGTSWDIGVITGSMNIATNTTYYAKMTWDGTTYKTALSTDGETYTDDMSVASTAGLYPTTMFIGGCSGSVIGHTPYPFSGIINMNKCYLYIAGLLVWQGMDDAGLATRADVSLSNLDSAGEARFTAKQDVISDLATIRSDATAGKSASDTISGYGNIVTHNTGDFATAAQGTLADSALQPNDNISELNNDSKYQTDTDVANAIAGKVDKVETFPTASATNLGLIVQYVGTTTETATNGYFYKCVQSGTSYVWENINVQKAASVDSLNYTIGTIAPSTTNFVEGTSYSVAQSIQRTANLFAGYKESYIDPIDEKIPSQASSTNQLADKAFVNSSIAASAANFRGNWATWAAVPTDSSLYPEDAEGSRIPTNNDYLVVQDASGYGETYTGAWRFLYIGTWSTAGKTGWSPSYRIGSAFTSAQQAAIDSGATSTLIAQISTNASDIGDLQTDKLDKVYTAGNKLYGTSNEGAQVTYTAGDNIQMNEVTVGETTTYNISATDTTYTAGDGIKIENNVISNTRNSAEWGNITGTLSSQTDLQTALNGKQATISDLATIRSNAEAGKSASDTISGYGNIVTHNTGDFATAAQGTLADSAIQPNDNISELNNDAGYITGITSSDVTTALGYTPYNSTNPAGYTSNVGTITGITMNGASKGTSGVVDLGTVITDISGKQDSLTTAQLNAVNSGITSAKVSTYDGYAATISGKQDKLTAGSNIDITGTTISATDTTYTAGNGLTLTGTEFSANVTNNVTSTSTTDALSANMGKELQDQIDNLKARGRYLSQWNAATGLPETQPTTLPYEYKAGDYFIVGTVGETNYKPTGTEYTGAASTTVETAAVAVEDTYIFDGNVWHLQQNTQKTVSFANLAGQPSDNTNLAAALNAKADDNAVVHLTGDETIAGTKTFSSTISGSIDGNAATATKATQDASGNVITTTYATKTELSGKQDALTAGTNISIIDNVVGTSAATVVFKDWRV